ncbi:unnamed protein product, partial [Allacma fusca]
MTKSFEQDGNSQQHHPRRKSAGYSPIDFSYE